MNDQPTDNNRQPPWWAPELLKALGPALTAAASIVVTIILVRYGSG